MWGNYGPLHGCMGCRNYASLRGKGEKGRGKKRRKLKKTKNGGEMSTIRTRPPNPRRPEMSTTTISNDERDFSSAAASADYVTKKLLYKHRKVAIFFAYCGVHYDGMQKYLGVKTIE